METLALLIQGSYAYLLIAEILVITALFLTLTWLIAKRTKLAAFDVELTPRAMPTAIPRETAAPEISPAERQALDGKLAEIQVESEKMKKVADENHALSDKVRFLESKLLEYEILQEEIGTLSLLKVENAELKQKIVYLEQGKAVPEGMPLGSPPTEGSPGETQTTENPTFETAEPLSTATDNVSPKMPAPFEPNPFEMMLASDPPKNEEENPKNEPEKSDSGKKEPPIGILSNEIASSSLKSGAIEPTQLTKAEDQAPVPFPLPSPITVPLAVFTAAAETGGQSPSPAPATSTEDSNELSPKSLESLLKQIDELTKTDT